MEKTQLLFPTSIILLLFLQFPFGMPASLTSNQIALGPTDLLDVEARPTHYLYVFQNSPTILHYEDRIVVGQTFSVTLNGTIKNIVSHDDNTLQNNIFLVQVEISGSRTDLIELANNFTSQTTVQSFIDPQLIKNFTYGQFRTKKYILWLDNNASKLSYLNGTNNTITLSDTPQILLYAGNKLFIYHDEEHILVFTDSLTALNSFNIGSSIYSISASEDGSQLLRHMYSTLTTYNTTSGGTLQTHNTIIFQIKAAKICYNNVYYILNFVLYYTVKVRDLNTLDEIAAINITPYTEVQIFCQSSTKVVIRTSTQNVVQIVLNGYQTNVNNQKNSTNWTNSSNSTNFTESVNNTWNNTLNNTNNTINNTSNSTLNNTSNSTLNATLNTTNVTNETSSMNEINNTNTTNNISESNQSETQPPPITPQPRQPYEDFFQSDQVQQAVDATGSFMATTNSISVFHQVFDPFYGTVEDFWFYKYHSEMYPYFVSQFTTQMDLMNMLKIKPSFLGNFKEIQVFQKNAQIYNEISKMHGRAPKQKYFLSAVKNVYTYSFLLAIAGFILINMIYNLFKRWKDQQGIKKALYEFTDRHSLYWNLLALLIDANLMFTTFSGFVQLLMPGCLDFKDKLNMALCILYLFMNMIFPFIFYPFIYRKVPKNKGDIVLTCAKFTLKGFLLQISITCIRNFLRGAIHAFFLKNYEVQIICLMATNILLVVVCIIFRRGFINKGLFITYVIYFLSFFAFDMLLYFRRIKLFPNVKYGEILPYVIFSILGFTGLKILIIIYEEIRQFVSCCRKRNSVENQAEAKSEKQEKKRQKKGKKKKNITQRPPPLEEKDEIKEEIKNKSKISVLNLSKTEKTKINQVKPEQIQSEELEEKGPTRLFVQLRLIKPFKKHKLNTPEKKMKRFED